jgi:hypothetical protein
MSECSTESDHQTEPLHQQNHSHSQMDLAFMNSDMRTGLPTPTLTSANSMLEMYATTPILGGGNRAPLGVVNVPLSAASTSSVNATLYGQTGGNGGAGTASGGGGGAGAGAGSAYTHGSGRGIISSPIFTGTAMSDIEDTDQPVSPSPGSIPSTHLEASVPVFRATVRSES